MAVTYRGKRTAFDNISVGNATGVERVIAGGGGESTTPHGGTVEQSRSVCDSSWTSSHTPERLLRSVCGDPTTELTEENIV